MVHQALLFSHPLSHGILRLVVALQLSLLVFRAHHRRSHRGRGRGDGGGGERGGGRRVARARAHHSTAYALVGVHFGLGLLVETTFLFFCRGER